jgi:DNA-binding NarL/FixJ family response regulator
MQRPRVLLGDDHVIFTGGLRTILHAPFEIVGTAQDGRQVVAAARRLHPDVIVLDISMPVMNGIKAARALRETAPSARIVFCTMQEDPALSRRPSTPGPPDTF